MHRKKLFFIALLSTMGSVAFVAHARLVAAGDVAVRFLAVGPAGLKIRGSAPSLQANETQGKLTVTVPVGNLDTGIGLRNRHLHHYLEADEFPKATLVVQRNKLQFPGNDQTIDASSSGWFTLHGVTRPLQFRYRAKRTGSDYHVQALSQIDIRDFKIKVPCYLGVCVHPNVKLKVRFKLREVN